MRTLQSTILNNVNTYVKARKFKVYYMTYLGKSIDSKRSIQKKNTESTERRKTSFAREQVENGGLHKPV